MSDVLLDDGALSKLRRLMELREARDEAKIALKKAEDDYRDAETDVYEALENTAIEGTIKVNLGEPWGKVSFLQRETYFGRIVDPNAALEHYEQRAMIDDMTEPKFAMKRVNEEVRDRKEQGLPMPPGIDYYARRGVTITRQKG